MVPSFSNPRDSRVGEGACAVRSENALGFPENPKKTSHFLVWSHSNLVPAPYISGMKERPFTSVIQRLKGAGLRPTRQRLALGKLLFDGADRHVTAEELHEQAKGARISVSLATVYNTLHQFTKAGLLREVVVEPGRAYFDTNVSGHHHFFFEDSGRIQDIAEDQITIASLPDVPEGTRLSRVDVVVRVAGEGTDIN